MQAICNITCFSGEKANSGYLPDLSLAEVDYSAR